MVISTKLGFFTGEGTPLYHFTGRTQAYRSKICLIATLSDLNPPPTGVVNGPLIATRCSAIVSVVSLGNHSPFFAFAFSPAYTSFQWIFLAPPYAFSTAASSTFCAAAHISGPIPSPSIKGMIGLSGTCNLPRLERVILAPLINVELFEVIR